MVKLADRLHNMRTIKFLKNKDKVALDYDCKITWTDDMFLKEGTVGSHGRMTRFVRKRNNLLNSKDFSHVVRGGELYNPYVKSYPCVMHMPWLGEPILTPLLDYLTRNDV